MSVKTYLLFTTNYPDARLEIILLNGKIKEKISNQVFIASLPENIRKNDLNYSTTDKPKHLEEASIKAIKQWKHSFRFDTMKEDYFLKEINLL